MDTLSARIRWILDNRTNPATGEPWREAQALAEAAGLKSPAHVGMMLRGDVRNPRPDTLVPVARAAGVSFEWLQRGVGSPDDATPDPRPADELPRFRELRGWAEMLAAAKALRPHTPAWVWEKVATMRYELEAEATQATVAAMGDFVLSHERVYRPREVTPATPTSARKGAA